MFGFENLGFAVSSPLGNIGSFVSSEDGMRQFDELSNILNYDNGLFQRRLRHAPKPEENSEEFPLVN